MAGAHPVELRLQGFKPWTTDIQVKANEPLELGPVKLGLPDGRLAVRRIRRVRAFPSPAFIAARRRSSWSCARISITASS